MSIVLDVKRVLKNSRSNKTTDVRRPQQCAENNDRKARHILGLETTYLSRKQSSASTSTNKARGVTFSDATTAAVSSPSVTEESNGNLDSPALSRKGSSVLLRGSSIGEPGEDNLKTQNSYSSLQSFYDKSRAPLGVSQQTSDSSSRDFALRRGTPSVLNTSSQEMEHSKQLRLFSRSLRKSRHDKKDGITLKSKSSLLSIVSPAPETKSEADGSEPSRRPISRISISRTQSREVSKSPMPVKHPLEAEHPYPMVKPVVDPSRAKINVRRPKVGTKNWFDNVDSDSSEGEDNIPEPQLHSDFATDVKSVFSDDHISPIPPRSSSTTSTIRQSMTAKPQTKHADAEHKVQHFLELADKLETKRKPRKRKRNPLEISDLTQQSVLYLSSSGEESDGEQSSTASRDFSSKNIRASLMNANWNDSEVEFGQAVTIDTRESDKLIQQLEIQSDQICNLPKPPVPQRSTSRLRTYLEDKSTDTLTQFSQQGNATTSLALTPTESVSRAESMQESTLSEDESIVSTKLMTVTRQEENLIAAMRLKKVAMRRAQTVVDRQCALQLLEMDSSNDSHSQMPHRRIDTGPIQKYSNSPLKRSLTHTGRYSKLGRNVSRQDSVTTFQTESVQERSVRSSIATYLSEGSEDLQLPYSSIDGLPIGSSGVTHQHNTQGQIAGKDRNSFASAATGSTSPTETSPSVRDSNIIVLDSLERQMLRGDIPSQLFMERPFLGWEARANMQAAH